MKLPPFSNVNVEDQRSPEMQRKMDFLLRYMAALEHRKREDSNIFDEADWEPHQDDAYNKLYPPSIYKEPDPDHELAPDFGKFRSYKWDDYIMSNIRKSRGTK